jgi:nitrate reductase gamma subunit
MDRSMDFLLYATFPYVAVFIGIVGSVYRFRAKRYSVSSLSSQFLESSRLFQGSAAFHYGILIVLAGHLVGLLFPRGVTWFNAVPVRLYTLETTALAFGLLALFGLVVLIYRRLRSPRVLAVSSFMDFVLLGLLLFQVASGIAIALIYRWGSAWYVGTATPYLWSLLALSPQPQFVAELPLAVRLHILSAWTLVAVIPFTRLVHFLSVPLGYLWRPYQLVIWDRKAAAAGTPGGRAH